MGGSLPPAHNTVSQCAATPRSRGRRVLAVLGPSSHTATTTYNTTYITALHYITLHASGRQVAPLDPSWTSDVMLPALCKRTLSLDLKERHGSVYMAAEVVSDKIG